MEAVSLDSPTILTPISRTDIAQKKTSMPREDLRPMFDKLVAHAAEKNASDIFINSENYISIKTDGQLNYTKKYMEEGDVYNLIEVIVRPEAYNEFLRTHELNMMVEVPNVTYLRVNVYLQKNVPGLVLRLIPANIPKLDDLELPVPGSRRWTSSSLAAGRAADGRPPSCGAMGKFAPPCTFLP